MFRYMFDDDQDEGRQPYNYVGSRFMLRMSEELHSLRSSISVRLFAHNSSSSHNRRTQNQSKGMMTAMSSRNPTFDNPESQASAKSTQTRPVVPSANSHAAGYHPKSNEINGGAANNFIKRLIFVFVAAVTLLGIIIGVAVAATTSSSAAADGSSVTTPTTSAPTDRGENNSPTPFPTRTPEPTKSPIVDIDIFDFTLPPTFDDDDYYDFDFGNRRGLVSESDE